MFTRRGFLNFLGTSALALWLPADQSMARYTGYSQAGRFLSACDGPDGQHFMAVFDDAGHPQFMLPASQRMHAAAVNPVRREQAVFIARRPGTEIYSVDLKSGTLLQTLASGRGRHFCGHGCFSPDGRYLYTSENIYKRNQGVISVRDATTLAVLDEWPTHGRDPHEIRLRDGGSTLVVANGGILTSPDRPGVNLAPEAMQPSLVYLDTADGKMRGEYRLHDRQLSIRHIDINDQGLVAVALQYEGAGEHRVPLLASHSGEDALQLFSADACDWRSMNQYTGSVKFAGTGDNLTAAVSSPRGNCLSFWNMGDRKMLAQHYIHDVCGIAYEAQARNFVVTTGAGAIHRFNVDGREASRHRAMAPEIHWDNHLLATS